MLKTLPPYTLAILTEDEIKTLATLAIQTYSETYPNYYTDEAFDSLFGKNYVEQQVPNEMMNKDFLYFTLKVNNTMVGYAKLIFNPKTSVVLLDKLYVLKKEQGKGYGSRLLNACYQEAENRDCSELHLKVWDKNEKALDFYQKHGLALKGDPIPYHNPDGSASSEFDHLMTYTIYEQPIHDASKDKSRASTPSM